MTTDVLVIGKTGQLARCLADCATKADDLAFEFWGRDTLDLATADDIAHQIEKRAPGIVINAAAYTAVDKAEDEPDIAMRVNGFAPGEIAKGAAACGAAIVHVSTDYVFDGESKRAYCEDDQTNPQGVYGRTKLEGEDAVARANPRHLIVRTAWVYSTYGNNFVKTMLRLAGERDEVSVVDDQLGCPTSAHDLAAALVEATGQVSKPGSEELFGTYHVAGTGTASWCELAALIFDELEKSTGKRTKLNPLLTSQYPTKATRPASSRLNCRKFADAFGHKLPYWNSSVSNTLATIFAG